MSDDWPRVTAVLDACRLGPDLSMVPPDVLAAAQARGTAVHEAAEAITYGYEVDTPEVARPYVAAFRRFLADSQFEPVAAEVLVTHPVWRYRGHPDLVGFLNGRRALLDLKTGASDGAAYQVAAYVDAWSAERPSEPVIVGAILHLRDDETYRFDEVELPTAMQVWRAALIVFGAQQECKR